jgi:hypothetical protein
MNENMMSFYSDHTGDELLEYFVRYLMDDERFPLVLIADEILDSGNEQKSVREELAGQFADLLSFCLDEQGTVVDDLEELALYHVSAMLPIILNSKLPDKASFILGQIRLGLGLKT